jgi:hypothetical protein
MPSVDLAISRPKKYLKGPKSLSQNFSLRREMNEDTAVGSLLTNNYDNIININ